MDKRILVTLAELEDMLAGCNYVVWLWAESVSPVSKEGPMQDLQAILGPDTVAGRIQLVKQAALLGDIEACLGYRGTSGHGPDRAVLRSARYRQARAIVAEHVNSLVAQSTTLATFAIRSGHPFPPIMWGFAYLFVTPERAEVFMGASSD